MSYSEFLKIIVNLLLAFIELLLGLRLLFKFIAISANFSFISWVYKSSDILLLPFENIFFSFRLGAKMEVELSTMLAMFVYALIVLFIVKGPELFMFYKNKKNIERGQDAESNY